MPEPIQSTMNQHEEFHNHQITDNRGKTVKDTERRNAERRLDADCALSSPYAQGVVIHWTGLNWTGLTQKSVKCLFQCRTEAKHTYSLNIACFRVFPRVGRGQRSRSYLMSFSNMRFSQSWMIEEYYFCLLYFSKRLEFNVCSK